MNETYIDWERRTQAEAIRLSRKLQLPPEFNFLPFLQLVREIDAFGCRMELKAPPAPTAADPEGCTEPQRLHAARAGDQPG